MRWNMETKEPITATNIHGEPYQIDYPVGIFEGNDFDYLEDLLGRLSTGEETGTEEDLDWIAGIFKYGMLTCCDGRHIEGQLKSLGYKKKGGGHNAV